MHQKKWFPLRAELVFSYPTSPSEGLRQNQFPGVIIHKYT